MQELPLVDDGQSAKERADAARNRRRILAAAALLVDERGIERVSMDDVARAASVGTGTLYRRFGDRAGLALALLDEQTRAFQEALIRGDPPLGPGVPAHDRLRAFGEGYLDLLERHAPLMTVGARLGRNASGPNRFNLAHLTILLREVAPRSDAEFLAQALLATLDPGNHLRAREGLGWSTDRLRAGWCALVDAISACPPHDSSRVPGARPRPQG